MSTISSPLRQPITFILILVAAWNTTVAGEWKSISFRGTDYQTVCASPAEVRLHWKDKAGNPIGKLSRLRQLLEQEGRTVEMVMNAGIYTKVPAPEGLHVENGKELVKLNTADGAGNFYLKPNGVFYIDEKNRARVVSTNDYRKRTISPRLATQSGPLLLRDGKVHPAFKEASRNKLNRNGVGVDKDGRIWFASVTRKPDNVTNLFNLPSSSARSAARKRSISMAPFLRWNPVRRKTAPPK
ncbi:MAG: phosphodiester glycosidase family protein [Verrucomicrobiae bacterium]|nr:phosphodiester glycosidase family protein [Verrucomicrobiae bacterium]